MHRIFPILILLFALLAGKAGAQYSQQDLKLLGLIKNSGQAEVVIPYPGREAIDIITRKVSITSVRDKNVYITLSQATADWFISSKFSYSFADQPASKGVITAGSTEEAMDWQSYPSYTDYVAMMQGFAASYPSLCDIDTIGISLNGKLVLVLKISDNVDNDENEPEVFYSSTMHGDELAGFVLMLRLADSLLTGYASGSGIKNMVDNLEIWINPLANPDGTYGTGNLISSPVRGNANGVDLNRNFPDPLDPAIEPEKENVDMMKFLRKRRFVISANFHSGYEVVNYPWDRWFYKYHADDSWFINISRAYADTVHKYSDDGYLTAENNGVTRGSDWYVIYGGRQDYVTWELQGREVTIELDYTKQTPAAQLPLLWNYNRRSLIRYLENALYGIHGIVRDEVTSEPVAAKIYIKFHDIDSSHIFSDTVSGTFTRLLYPRTWDISFSARGYRDTTVTTVVTAGQRTDLVVEMKPVSTRIDSIESLLPLLYPNPADQSVTCILPELFSGNITVMIFGQSGIKFADYKTVVYPLEPFNLDLSGLPPGVFSVRFINNLTGESSVARLVLSRKRF
jgi:hypothetical protein